MVNTVENNNNNNDSLPHENEIPNPGLGGIGLPHIPLSAVRQGETYIPNIDLSNPNPEDI